MVKKDGHDSCKLNEPKNERLVWGAKLNYRTQAAACLFNRDIRGQFSILFRVHFAREISRAKESCVPVHSSGSHNENGGAATRIFDFKLRARTQEASGRRVARTLRASVA